MNAHNLEEPGGQPRKHGRHIEHCEGAVSVAALLENAVREGRALWVEWGDGDGEVVSDDLTYGEADRR